jgi:hypothetical protein
MPQEVAGKSRRGGPKHLVFANHAALVRKCFNCGKMGHAKKDCPEEKKVL